MPIPQFGYWNIRGLGQPVRLILNYVGEKFEDKQYECGPAPEYNRQCWNQEKMNKGLSFPNLPFYIDGEVKLTQSNAILRYIARKHDLCGKTEQEKWHVDLLAEESMDFRNALVRLCYNPEFNRLKPNYLKNLPNKLTQFDKFLKDSVWFAGQNLTFVDFIMYELLDQHRAMDEDCLKEFSKLTAFLDRFEALPAIKTYMASDKFLKNPINNKMAKFGRE